VTASMHGDGCKPYEAGHPSVAAPYRIRWTRVRTRSTMAAFTSHEIEPAGCAMASSYHSVMISSTYVELKDHRAAVSQVVLGLGMFPLDMGDDAALSMDFIAASLDKVNKADAYVGLISYRYGQIIEDPRNPDRLSLTELEFRRAVERDIPRCMFIMADNHTPGIPRSMVLKEVATQDKLTAFIARARESSICAEFNSVDDLKAKAAVSLVRVGEALSPPPTSASTAGVEIFFDNRLRQLQPPRPELGR